MRLGFIVFLMVCQWAAVPAQAGAWLREKGSSFTAISFSANYFRDIENNAYLEFGLRDDLTLGADVSMSTDRTGLQAGHGTIFMRKALWFSNDKNKWAYELGIGATWKGEDVLPHIKTGLSWGRGIQIRDKYGWMSVDASVRWDIGGGAVTKLDGTVGLNFTDVTSGMMQIFVSHTDGETSGTFAPSILIKPRKGKFRFQVGLESPLNRFDDTSIKLGLWRDF